jgi:hypothetical protein
LRGEGQPDHAHGQACWAVACLQVTFAPVFLKLYFMFGAKNWCSNDSVVLHGCILWWYLIIHPLVSLFRLSVLRPWCSLECRWYNEGIECSYIWSWNCRTFCE